ncbi:MAG: hypothetical protein ACMG6S_28635, partial [Byssovorax sp.]
MVFAAPGYGSGGAASRLVPLHFFDRDHAAVFLRSLAAQPEGRDSLQRIAGLAGEALGGAGLGAPRDLEDSIFVLARHLARGTLVVTPLALPRLSGLDGDREEPTDAPRGVPVAPAQAESRLWEGRVLTIEPPRWSAACEV